MKSYKIVMICLIVSIGLSGRANASEELTGFTRVMSYDELMTLSPDNRIEYVQGLRELLIEMEETGQDSAQIDSLRQMLRLFEAWIPEARADQELDPRSNAVPVVESANNVSVVRCPSRTEAVQVRGPEHSKRPTFFVCQVGAKTTEPCANGFVSVMQEADAKFRCVSRASFESLTMTSRLIARTKNPSAAKAGNAKANANFESGGPSAASLKAIVDQQKEADKKAQEAEEKAAREKAAKEAAAKRAAAKAAKKLANKVAKPASDRVAVSKPTRPAATADVKAPKESKTAKAKATSHAASKPEENDSAKASAHAPVQEKETDTTSEAKKDSKAKRETASMGSCSPDSALPATCNAKTVEAARKKYATDSNPDCIYAGSVSVYKDGQKKSFACEPPTRFCFGSANCESEVGGKMEAAYSCAAGQVICNPMLFGIKPDGETPFCVSRQKNATLACENESSGEKARHPFVSSKANPTGWKKTTGLREAWDEFARRLFQLCHKNQVSMALHCRECHVIKKRLFDLNVAVRGVKNCGAALRFQKERCEENGACAQPARAGSKGSSTVTETEKKKDRIPATDSPDESPTIEAPGEAPGEKPSGMEAQPAHSSDERSSSQKQ